ncbi:hypothetical protein CR513_17267, partial [Mucuna pruriens]
MSSDKRGASRDPMPPIGESLLPYQEAVSKQVDQHLQMGVRAEPSNAQSLIIMFSEEDMRDEPMVIFVITTEYRVERSTFQKLGLLASLLEECSGTLYGFANKQVEIRGIVELETKFGMGSGAQSISVLYIVVDTWASYNGLWDVPL